MELSGCFALISCNEKDTFECLCKYRCRETIESFFEVGKQHANGTRPRVWSPEALRGRMLVQFIALCYYEYFSDKLRKLKKALNDIHLDESLTKTVLTSERKMAQSKKLWDGIEVWLS